jgi:CheY-like chemotaxis protein
VLIMDDEIIIRNSAGRVLSRLGHEVQYAAHGEEVIALYQKAHESQHAFDLWEVRCVRKLRQGNC